MSHVFIIGDTIQELQPESAVNGPVMDLNPFNWFKKKPAAPAPAAKPVATDPAVQYVFDQAARVHNALVGAGVSEPAASYGTYAAFHETGGFGSTLYKQHNNATGINFAGQQGAVKGNNGYAWWPDGLAGWAKAYRHELTKGTNPAGAGNLEDFARRLKDNRYYQDSYDNYLHGLKRARLVLKVIPAADRAGYNPNTGLTQDPRDLDIPGSTQKDPFKWWKDLKTVEKVGIGLAAAGVTIAILKR